MFPLSTLPEPDYILCHQNNRKLKDHIQVVTVVKQCYNKMQIQLALESTLLWLCRFSTDQNQIPNQMTYRSSQIQQFSVRKMHSRNLHIDRIRQRSSNVLSRLFSRTVFSDTLQAPIVGYHFRAGIGRPEICSCRGQQKLQSSQARVSENILGP